MVRSDHELSAMETAVEAVERRWQHQHDAELRLRRRKFNRSLLAWLFLALSAIVGGVLVAWHKGVKIPDVMSLCSGRPSSVQNMKVDSSSVVRRDAFVSVLEAFKRGKIFLWGDAPHEVVFKNAQAGLVYHFLKREKDGRPVVFQLVAQGGGAATISLLSPVANPIPLTMSEFRKACLGSVCLVECKGVVYLWGTKDLARGRAILQGL